MCTSAAPGEPGAGSPTPGSPRCCTGARPSATSTTTRLTALAAARRPGVARSSYDVPRTTGLVPDGTRGFAGTPALEGHRVGGSATATTPSLVDWEISVGDSALTCASSDAEAGWDVRAARPRRRRPAPRAHVGHQRGRRRPPPRDRAHRAPVGAHATELLDLPAAGARSAHRSAPVGAGHAPPRRPHGRTGHDATLLWSRAPLASPSAPARPGPCTPRGAATTRPTPSARPRATACSAAASCVARRGGARSGRDLPLPGCSGRARPPGSTRSATASTPT